MRSWDELTGRFDRSGYHRAPSKLRGVAIAMSRRHGHAEVFRGKTREECAVESFMSIVQTWYDGKIWQYGVPADALGV